MADATYATIPANTFYSMINSVNVSSVNGNLTFTPVQDTTLVTVMYQNLVVANKSVFYTPAI